MTLLLSNNLDEMDDDEKTLPMDKVEVDLALSAHANARRWYEQKKKQESKKEKTVTAHEKAFKATERKTRLQLNQVGLMTPIVKNVDQKTISAISSESSILLVLSFNYNEKFVEMSS
ncbi:hypothetical protein JHK87_006364 [Glycine soja]|nr:hypothetical protein JHK87_006364 [Glycine soja]